MDDNLYYISAVFYVLVICFCVAIVPINTKALPFWAIFTVAFGFLRLFLASIRPHFVRGYRVYIVAAPLVWFCAVNKIIADARIGWVNHDVEYGTIEALGLFMVGVVLPTLMVRHWVCGDDRSIAACITWGGMCDALLFVALQGNSGVYVPSIIVSLGIPAMFMGAWLSRNKFGLNPTRSFSVGLGLLLMFILVGTELGFMRPPRIQHEVGGGGTGQVTLYYAPWESGEQVAKDYERGIMPSLGYDSGRGSRSFNEVYMYVITMSGLQILLLAGVSGLGIVTLVRSSVPSKFRRYLWP